MSDTSAPDLGQALTGSAQLGEAAAASHLCRHLRRPPVVPVVFVRDPW
ncbi:hypothetical protein AB0J80_11190 [Actinoplanes sp. NPDC049548]